MTDRTQVGHWLKDDCDVYAGRGKGGRDMLRVAEPNSRGWLGNPHTVDEWGRDEAIARFRKAFEHRVENDERFRAAIKQLHGKTLGCWCQRVDADGPACHAEVIAEWADKLAEGDE